MARLRILYKELDKTNRKLRKLEKRFRFLTFDQIENSEDGDRWNALDEYRHDIEIEIFHIRQGVVA